MTIQEIKNFLLLVEYGSFTKAANATFISQQALSKSISQLERFFGFPLFTRSYHHIALTEKGELLYQFFSNAQDNFHALLSTFDVDTRTGMETFRVGYVELLDMSLFMQQQLHGFRGEGELPLLIVERISSQNVVDKLLNDELDMCFYYPNDVLPSPLDHFPVQANELFLCVSKNNPKINSNSTYRDFSDLVVYEAEGYKQLGLHNSEGKYRHVLESVMERDGLGNRNVSIQALPTLESIVTAVENGQGIAIFPGSNPLTKSPTIQTYPLHLTSYVHCAYNRKNQRPMITSFVNHLKIQLNLGNLC